MFNVLREISKLYLSQVKFTYTQVISKSKTTALHKNLKC
jgi:hypothetical protein